MLTTDDRRTREVLIQTHAVFADPKAWIKGAYQQRNGGRCLMGEVRHQLGLSDDVITDPLYASVNRWFRYTLGRTAEGYNDAVGREQVRRFLSRRIADLEEELVKEARPKAPGLVLAMLSLFGL